MMKWELKKYGITDELIGAILKDNLGIQNPISWYSIDEIKKGILIHSNLYKITMRLGEGKEPEYIFMKDAKHEATLSGDVIKSRELDENEANFLAFGTENKTFTPHLFYRNDYVNKDNKNHVLTLMENYDMSLEEKLIELYDEKMFAEKNKEEGKIEDVEKKTFDYLLRSIDIYLVNNKIATDKFTTKDYTGMPKVYNFSKEQIQAHLNQYLLGLVFLKSTQEIKEKKISKNDELINLLKKNASLVCIYKDMAGSLSYIADKIKSEPDNGIVLFDPIPSHILIKKHDKLEDYNVEDIFKIRQGKTDTPTYNLFAVTDYNKIGYGPSSLGIAALLNHPSVFRLLPQNKIKQLIEHIIVAKEKIKSGEDIRLEQIDSNKKSDFQEKYAAGSRFAALHNISTISWLNLKYPEKMKDLYKRNPLYETRSFINMNIDHLINLENQYDRFTSLNQGLEKLKLDTV